MKKLFLATLALIGMTATLAQAGPVELKFTSVYIDRHPVVQNAFIPWMEEVKKRTNGEVVITYFNPGTICPNVEMFNSVKNGSVDIASNNTNATNGALPLQDAGNMPFMFKNVESAAMAMWRLTNSQPDMKKEFEGTKHLASYTSAIMMIHSTKKPINTLNDIKGMKVAVVGGFDRDIVKALKANPIMVPLPDQYMSLSRGMADACCLAIAPLRSFKITETIKYTLNKPFAASPMWMAMSENAWKKLTPEQQKVITETSGEMLSRAIGRALDEGVERDSKWMAENGHTFVVPSAEEDAKLAKALSGLEESWAAKMEKQGKKSVRAILANLKELSAATAAELAK